MIQLILLILLVAVPSALGTPFGTVNGKFGQHAEHERITRAALNCGGNPSNGDCFEPRSLDQLAGRAGTLGAVGEPDEIPPAGPEAHCDDADFFNVPGYPQSRVDATAALQRCVTNLKNQADSGITGAKGMLNDKDELVKKDVDTTKDCPFKRSGDIGNAKCIALLGFGRALHGVQDFHSHSNWADTAPAPFSLQRPPGLAQAVVPQLLDLRSGAGIAGLVPQNLTTGCFSTAELVSHNTGSFACKNRIIHYWMNKDEGIIDPATGDTSQPDNPRGQIIEGGRSNFDRAVQGAISATRWQWENFRGELKSKYGDAAADKMICAITRDDPIKDCQGRKVGLVIDSSGSNQDTDPSNLRITAGQEFVATLTTKAEADAGADVKPDRVTVVDFDDFARVVYPLGDPSGANFDGIDSEGGTLIASGVETAIEELTKDSAPDETADRTGIVVLTDGEDSDVGALDAAIAKAGSLGIRVAFGFLSPPIDVDSLIPRSVGRKGGKLVRREPSADLLSAILKTGGIFSTIDSAGAQKSFVDLVLTHGLTGIDNSDAGTALLPGLTIAGLTSSKGLATRFTYTSSAGEKLNITIRSVGGAPLTSVLHDIRGNVDLKTVTTDSSGTASILYTAPSVIDLELGVTAAGSNGTAGGLVFTVGLNTSGHNSPNGTNSTSTALPPRLNTTSTSSLQYPNTTAHLPITTHAAPSLTAPYPTTHALPPVSHVLSSGSVSTYTVVFNTTCKCNVTSFLPCPASSTTNNLPPPIVVITSTENRFAASPTTAVGSNSPAPNALLTSTEVNPAASPVTTIGGNVPAPSAVITGTEIIPAASPATIISNNPPAPIALIPSTKINPAASPATPVGGNAPAANAFSASTATNVVGSPTSISGSPLVAQFTGGAASSRIEAHLLCFAMVMGLVSVCLV